MIGQTLGHYRVLEKIGQGGMGVVYRARDERLERDVALKVLPASALADEAARRRFRKEALALARLNHPNIGAIFDFDCQDGLDFLVMEYVPGATVGEKVGGGIAQKEILQLGRQLAAGLGAAHEQGIVHRDLKPANLRVTPDGQLKILDFGLAKLLHPASEPDATATMTEAGAVAGTLPYMAPEQLRGERIDARTDIYATGAVLYEMATGQRPFGNTQGPRLIDAILHQTPQSASSLHRGVSPALEAVIEKALDKDPERRYQSAQELRIDLERIGAPTDALLSATAPDQSQVSALEIAHVLFMDIVAYSRMPMDKQQKALRYLQKAVQATAEFTRAEARDELIRLPTGDGMALVFFGDPEAPVRCALELSRALQGNAEIPLRMGVHAGPVYRVADINANRNVAGGGINIAQRVMDCGDAGHVLVSEAVASVLSQLSGWADTLHDLGDVEVKHGVRVHLFNLCTVDAGNPALPQKIRAAPASTLATVSTARAGPGSRVWHTARLHPRLSSVSALGAFGALALLWWLVAARPVLSFAPRDFILVTEFDNQTGDPLFDRSLLTALDVSLEQSAHANVFPSGRIAESLRRMGKKAGEKVDESTGREICLRESLRALLSPAITRVGQQYAISARLINPQTGAAARSYLERAKDQDHILDAVGRVATKIRRDLGEPLLATWKGDRPLPQVTTASLQALKLYADGLDFWTKGQYNAGVGAWRSALQADPDFAMAHAAVGNAMYSFVFHQPAEGKTHYDRALQLSERTTERERLYIQAKYAGALNHYSEAAQRFELYLKNYPDDWRVRTSLADLYRGNDRPQEAIEQFKEVLRLSPSSAGAYVNMATCYIALGQFSEGLHYWEEAFKLEPSWITNGNLNHEYGFTLIHAGNEAKAREVFEKALALPDLRPRGLRSFAYLDLLHGRYRDAKARLQEALLLDTARKTPLSELREHGLLAMVDEGLGDRASRIRELDLALPLLFTLPEKGRPAVWLGVPYARSGVAAKAAQILDAVKPLADMNNPVQASDVHMLEGEVELARGNKDHALELLLLADREKSSGLTLASLARAYQLTGDTEQAIRWNEALLGPKDSLIGWEPQQDWIAAHVNLAKLYLARGEKDKAAARLNEFFAIWKDADPDLPLLKEAQRLQKEVAR